MIFRACLIVSFIVFPIYSYALLIDNDTYTTDTNTNLDWLDLSTSAGQLYTTAETLNIGWRYASNSEVEILFSTFFEDFYPNTTYGQSSSYSGPVYTNQISDILNFQRFFGFTGYDNHYTYGLYENEEGLLSSLGGAIYS